MATAAAPPSASTGTARAGHRAPGLSRRQPGVAGSGGRGRARWPGRRPRGRVGLLTATLARRAPGPAVATAAPATRSIALDAGGCLRGVAAASVTEVPDGLHHRGHRPRRFLVVTEHAQRLR